MTKAKKKEPESLIPVWVHKPGLKGYDSAGVPVDEMEVNQYGFATKIVPGMQPASTGAMELKSYNVRQIKANK